MFKYKKITVLLAAAAVAGMSASAGALADTTLKMAYPLQNFSHFGIAAQSFQDTVEGQGTGYHIKQYQNVTAFDGKAIVQAVQDGDIDLAVVPADYVRQLVPQVGVFGLPYMFASLDQARKALDGQFGQGVLADLGGHNVVPLAWGEQGFTQISNNERPIRVPADAKGLKIRAVDNPDQVLALKTIGVDAVQMAWPQAVGAMRDGVINGQENTYANMMATRVWKEQKYVSETNMFYEPAVFLMSPKAYNAMSASDQQFFKQTAVKARNDMRDFISKIALADGTATLENQGMAVNKVDRDAFVKAVEPAYEQYNKAYGQDVINSLRNTR